MLFELGFEFIEFCSFTFSTVEASIILRNVPPNWTLSDCDDSIFKAYRILFGWDLKMICLIWKRLQLGHTGFFSLCSTRIQLKFQFFPHNFRVQCVAKDGNGSGKFSIIYYPHSHSQMSRLLEFTNENSSIFHLNCNVITRNNFVAKMTRFDLLFSARSQMNAVRYAHHIL